MRAILIILCLHAAALAQSTRPSTQPADRHEAFRKLIYKTVLQLQAPDAKTRDAASERLMAIGPAAIPIMKEVIENGASPELEARANKLISQIPEKWKYATPEGGEVVAGFQVTLRKGQEKFIAGQPMKLSLKIRNVGGKRRKMASLRGLDLEVDGKLFSTRWADARVVIKPLNGAKLPLSARALVFSRGEPEVTDVALGGSLTDTIDLSNALQLPAGEYQVQVFYYILSHQLAEDALNDGGSNVIRLHIEPK